MKRYLRWIPLILSLLLIFGLTFQNGAASKQLTENTQSAISSVVNSHVETNWWNNYILMRKLAHIPEYFLLGMSSVIALRKWWKAGMLCVAVSLLDQIVKWILPGREFDFVDMRFDLIGYVVGILVMAIVLRIKNRRADKERKGHVKKENIICR